MRRAFASLAFAAMLAIGVVALAQPQPLRGKIVTEDGQTIQVAAFKNLLGKYQCRFGGMDRYIPLKDIASIESGGTKFEMGSLLTASPTAAYKATVTMRDGRRLEVELPRGRHPIGVLIDSSLGQLVFFADDSLSGGMRQASIKPDDVAKLVFE